MSPICNNWCVVTVTAIIDLNLCCQKFLPFSPCYTIGLLVEKKHVRKEKAVYWKLFRATPQETFEAPMRHQILNYRGTPFNMPRNWLADMLWRIYDLPRSAGIKPKCFSFLCSGLPFGIRRCHDANVSPPGLQTMLPFTSQHLISN